ncbi:MAG: hypothetical protein LLG14_01575 [Nocardiaceae bacterium]|nr:hypothetical protein [Nocardiaceae bacterium]
MLWLFVLAIIMLASPVAISVTSLIVAARRAARWQATMTTDELGVLSSSRV